MTKVKFRGWHKIDLKMIDMDGLCFIHCGSYNSLLIDAIIGINKNIEIMQYTGLKDKNGVEIYEGDVVYLAGYGLYEAIFPFVELYEAHFHEDIGQIKGNIYENYELLEQR